MIRDVSKAKSGKRKAEKPLEEMSFGEKLACLCLFSLRPSGVEAPYRLAAVDKQFAGGMKQSAQVCVIPAFRMIVLYEAEVDHAVGVF